MAPHSERDTGLLGLVERLVGRSSEPREVKPAPAVVPPDDGLGPLLQNDAAPGLLEPQLTVEGPQTKTPAEMAEIILRALQAIEGCPRRGFEVTVYGAYPWNAMLRITPAAGAIDAALWRARVREMAHVMRGQYEVGE